jgi:hypothetical protein
MRSSDSIFYILQRPSLRASESFEHLYVRIFVCIQGASSSGGAGPSGAGPSALRRADSPDSGRGYYDAESGEDDSD